MEYDRNGLKLSPVSNSLNSYLHTAVNLNNKKYAAYAQASRPNGQNQWAMFKIGFFEDPRDAAFVAQSFQNKYTRENIRQMVTDNIFDEIVSEFMETIEIPEWVYPPEGILMEDIISDYGYKKNRVSDAKDALREVISVFGLKPPPLKDVKNIVSDVEALYKKGMTYREAARKIMNVNEGEAV